MNRRKRVLIFDTFSRAGGGLAYISNIAGALTSSAHHWDWVFYCNPAIKGRIDALERSTEVLYGPNVLAKGGFRGYLHRKSVLSEAIRKCNPDILLAMNQLDTNVNIPTVLFLRNALYFSINNPEMRKLFPFRNILQCLILRNASLKSIQRADCIVTASNAFKNLVLHDTGISNVNTSVVPFGLNNSTFNDGPHLYNRNSYEILFLQFEFYKGLDIALQAVRKLIDNGYNIRLTVTDNLTHHKTTAAQEAVKLIDSLHLWANVQFAGHVNQNELPSIYAKSDVFWFPSYIESFGHGLLEAMANGLPCVVTDLEVFREIGGKSVQYFPMGDHNSLASMTAQIFDNRAHYAELGRMAKERAFHFTWANHVQTMEKLFFRMISAK